jgi:uncharacterized membrane protein HdeD (DUF308 family)
MSTTVKDVAKLVSKPSILLSILLIVLGLLAIALPLATSLGVAIVVGWLILFGGLVQVAHAFQSKGIGHVIWKLLVAVFYLFAGVYLISHPALGMFGLTLALAIFLFCGRHHRSDQLLFDAQGGRLGLDVVRWGHNACLRNRHLEQVAF